MKNVLMILTSHDTLGTTGDKTGFWLEEFAAPYYAFVDAGVNVTLASPKGGQPPLDPKSDQPDAQTDDTRRFRDDDEAQQRLATTKKLDDIDAADFDAVFVPGGHGPMWDLATDHTTAALLAEFFEADKPVGSVCHGPAALVGVTDADGTSYLDGKRVTAFTNSEEEGVGLTEVVPFLLEDRLRSLAGSFERGDDWAAYVVTDGTLITGQNPASSGPAAEALLELLGVEAASASH
jgi:putative intracellular protease/amidase